MKTNIIYKPIIFLSLLLALLPNGFAQNSDSSEIKLNPEQLAAFQKQAIHSVTDLSRHISVMADKNEDKDRRENAIDLAVKLFSSERNIVQISLKNSSEIKNSEIRDYFNSLAGLAYTSVKITWYDIYLSSEFKLGPDKKYYGAATIFQKFEGLGNNEIGSYKDVTRKNIQVITEEIEYFEDGVTKKKWVLKLGDIKVEETR